MKEDRGKLRENREKRIQSGKTNIKEGIDEGCTGNKKDLPQRVLKCRHRQLGSVSNYCCSV